MLLWGLLTAPAEAQETPPETYGGSFWTRPRLTGNWGGLRDDLAKRGVTLDVDVTQVLQGVASGGRETGVKYGGVADQTLNVDTGKLGLWPGGFLKAHLETNFGENVNGMTGAIVPVDTPAVFPAPAVTFSLMNLTFAQFLSPWFGLYGGKVETLDGDANEFAHDYRTQFLNMGFAFNLTSILVPISALGGGVILLPTQDPAEAIINISVLDANGTPTTSGFDNAFQDGVVVAGQARVRIKPFGLVGHQTLGATWSNKERVSLEQDPTNIFRALLFNRFPRLQDPGPILRRILERRFPQLLVPVQPLNQTDLAWNIYYNFDQYFWQPQGDPNRGVGVFFRFGVSDGDVNPVKYAYNVGIGGKGAIPGRPRDNFGVGWSRVQISNNLVPFLRQALGLGLDHEDAVELFYDVAITPWLRATADLQIVMPGLKKELNSANQLTDLNTAVVGGLRVYTRF
jgi:porin